MRALFFKGIISTLFLTFLFLSTTEAQNTSADVKTLGQFKQIQEQLPRESVYLHTDRSWYYQEERLWFSAYTVAGGFLQPSSISKVLYLELVSPSGDIVNREMVEISEGRAEGSLKLEDLNEGTGVYELRAYTKWGRNFGDSYVFKKKISILTPDQSTFSDKAQENQKLDVQFFPESGHLIDGLSTNLAFKAIGEDGLGLSVQGSIIDQSGNSIDTFETEHEGMGVIGNFIPDADKKYTAIIGNNKFKLPDVQPKGALFTINDDGNFYKLTFRGTEEFHGQSMLLFAHVRGIIYHAGKIEISENQTTEIIPKNTFPTGIVHFSMLNNQGIPVAERLTFSKNEVDALEISASLDQNRYSHRERAQLDIEIEDANGEAVTATASLSVYDDGIVSYNTNQQNIYSHLLLGTQIKGHIENPGFYFSDREKADEYLDILLLTQGWRAYEVNLNQLSQQLEEYQNPEKGISISGKVTSLLLGRPLEESVVFLSMGENEDAQIITTDKQGRFVADGLDFSGIKAADVKANKKDGSNRVWIEIDEQFSQLPSQVPAINQQPVHSFQQQEETDGADFENRMQERTQSAIANAEQFVEAQLTGDLGEFTVSEKALENNATYNEPTSTNSGMGTFIDADRIQNLYANLSVEQMLAQLPGVNYNFSTQQLTVRSNFNNFSGIPGPIILVDGMETDLLFIRSLNVSAIQSVSVTRSAVDNAIYGARGAGGVISIKTKTGNWRNAMDRRGYKTSAIQGFQTPTTFYTPKYGVNIPKDHPKIDNRLTIHWEPNIELSQNQPVINFWTNDVSSTYRIVLEGITETGMPFYKTTTLEVAD